MLPKRLIHKQWLDGYKVHNIYPDKSSGQIFDCIHNHNYIKDMHFQQLSILVYCLAYSSNCDVRYLGHQAAYFEVAINGVKLFRMFGQLRAYVFRADENGLQVRPCPLYLEPDGDDRV